MFTNNCVLNLIDSTIESNVLFPNEIKGKAKEFDPIGTNLLSVFSINIRSLKANFGLLQMFLQSTDFQFSVIALCETWLNDGEESLFNLPGFNKFFINREKRGGGLIIFVRDNITAHVLPQLTIVNDTFEILILIIMIVVCTWVRTCVECIIFVHATL